MIFFSRLESGTVAEKAIAGTGMRFALPSAHASQSVELIHLAREESIDHEVINSSAASPFHPPPPPFPFSRLFVSTCLAKRKNRATKDTDSINRAAVAVALGRSSPTYD